MAALGAEDRYPTDEERNVALEAVADHSRTANVFGAYLGGSLAVGLGHGSSDIDVYVLVDRPSTRPRRSRSIGPFRVEVKEISVDELRSLAATCSRYYARSAERSQTNMPEVRLKQLIDFYVGLDLQKSPYLDSARRDLSPQALRQILMSRHAIVAAGWSDDAGGAAQHGDWATALESSAMAIRAAAEVALAATNDIYIAGKFVFRRLSRNRGLSWMATVAWRLIHVDGVLGAGGPTTSWDALSERLLFANSIVSFSLVRAWERCVPAIAVEDLASWAVDVSASGPWRHPYFGLLRFSDGFGLAGPIDAFRTDPFTASVWSLLDGRSPESLAHRLASETAMSYRQSLRSVSAALECLDRAGLVMQSRPRDPKSRA